MFQTISALVKKEFLQVIRDRNMLRLIFIIPIVQMFVLAYAIDTDVKKIYTAVYDFDGSELSREYVRSMSAGDYFITGGTDISITDADRGFKENRYNVALIIPEDFSRDFAQLNQTKVGLLVDGTNANSASIALGYANLMTARFNQRQLGLTQPVTLNIKKLYNPEGESIYYMVPGIVAVLLTMITMMLTSMAIVREREIGTLEQLMVTPISTPALILGKTIPFAIIGFIELSVALFLGVTWFSIPFAGSWGLLYALSFLYLFTTLGAGMLISTISSTQQQAMFFTWFFAIFAILTSGFFTPISNMPKIVQYLTYINPLRFFMVIVRGIMMKGATIDVLYPQVLAMIIFGTCVFSFAWIRFSKRVK